MTDERIYIDLTDIPGKDIQEFYNFLNSKGYHYGSIKTGDQEILTTSGMDKAFPMLILHDQEEEKLRVFQTAESDVHGKIHTIHEIIMMFELDNALKIIYDD